MAALMSIVVNLDFILTIERINRNKENSVPNVENARAYKLQIAEPTSMRGGVIYICSLQTGRWRHNYQEHPKHYITLDQWYIIYTLGYSRMALILVIPH